MYSKRNYKNITKFIIFLLHIIALSTISIYSYANNDNSVNVITWWGYLNPPEVAKEVKDKCHVDMSFDTYYTNNEFLRRVKTNSKNYDIIIFSNTIYNLIKNKIPRNKVNLSDFSNNFNPIIKKEYLRRNFPSNVTFFMHSLSGFLWNPKVIKLTNQDDLEKIYNKAGNNIVVMIDDPMEIWNLINKAYDDSAHNNKNVQLNLLNFKKLVQNTTVYLANNYNQIYDQDTFAFAFGWSGDAIVYMKQAKKPYKFLIHPKLSYISTDLMVAMNENPKTICVANVLMSKKVLDIVQNNTYYFSPYGDYIAVHDSIYQSLYQEVFKKLPQMSWLESSVSSSDYDKMLDAWNEIQLNTRGN